MWRALFPRTELTLRETRQSVILKVSTTQILEDVEHRTNIEDDTKSLKFSRKNLYSPFKVQGTAKKLGAVWESGSEIPFH